MLACMVALAVAGAPGVETAWADGSASGSSKEGSATPASGGASSSPAPAAPLAVPADRQADKVVIITIHEPITTVTVDSIRRRLTLAERGGADCVVFDINTPGGEVGAVIEICGLIKASPIRKSVAWINPQAISGGAIVALACREIVFNDPAHMGDAMPVGMSLFEGMKALPDEELKKILPVLLGNVLDSVRRHNEGAGRYEWDEFLAQSMVVNDLQLWWVRNKATGDCLAIGREEAEMLFPGQSLDGKAQVAGGAAPSMSAGTPSNPDFKPGSGGDVPLPSGSAKLSLVEPGAIAAAMSTSVATSRPTFTSADAGQYELVHRITEGTAATYLSADQAATYGFAANVNRSADGRTITINPIRSDADIKAFVGAKHVRRLDRSWSEGLVVFLTNVWVRAIFFIIFLVALAIELSHPGVTLPGVVAVVALLLVIAPAALIGMAGWWTIAAILSGLALVAFEIFVLPGIGVAGISGAILLFAGILGAFIGAGGLFPDTEVERASRLWGMTSLLGGLFTAGVAFYFIAKHLESLPLLNRLVLNNAPLADESEGPSLLEAMGEGEQPIAAVGSVGVAVTPLRPAGKIEIGDRVLDAVADIGFIQAGAKVRVVSASEFRVAVEEVAEARPDEVKEGTA